MSKVLDNKLVIPEGIICSLDNKFLSVKGKNGENLLKLADCVKLEGDSLILDETLNKCLFNTSLKLIKNAFIGSINGFSTIVNLHGVGYKVEKIADRLDFYLGYSHKISVNISSEVECDIKSNTQMVFKSCSKQLLGDFVAKVLRLRKPNPYKLKGVLVEGQFVRKKEGKK